MDAEDHLSVPSKAGMPLVGLRLSAIHQQIADVLRDHSVELADMYVGAVAVLRDKSNPDRIAQAANSLRNLMSTAPRFMDLSAPLKDPPRLGDTVRAHSARWRVCQKKSKNHSDGKWEGQIDLHLHAFLQQTEEFFSSYDSTHVTLMERATIVVRHLEPLKEPSPDQLEKNRAKQWRDMYDFLTKTLHRGAFPADEELDERAEELGRFLLAGWRPDTAADQQALKKIIEEGEAN